MLLNPKFKYSGNMLCFMEQIYSKIWELAKPYYEKGRVYDIEQIEWMMKEGKRIADIEKLDKRILLPLIILHDVGFYNVENKNPHIKDPKSKKKHMQKGAIIARKILEKASYDSKLTEKIIYLVSVHDNWALGDDLPYKENKEMAVFNDLDFLYAQSSFKFLELTGKSMGFNPREAYEFWKTDEKLTRRPFCCEETKKMFEDSMAKMKRMIEEEKGL